MLMKFDIKKIMIGVKIMHKYIGDKAFYKSTLHVVFPIIIQNMITNFVALIDNLMVGQVGTAEMSGVAVVNQLLFIFSLAIFGTQSAAGIFGAQFYGKEDYEGVKNIFKIKILFSAIITVIGVSGFLLFNSELISLYLSGSSDGIDVAKTLDIGTDYMNIMVIGLIPFALVNIHASTLRESGETVLPMKAGVIAVITNTVLNFGFIFGNFGLPELGAIGAGIATVIARFVEITVILIAINKNSGKYFYLKGALKKLTVPLSLVKTVITKGSPIIVNETFWSIAMSILMGIYSIRGVEVVAAFNISNTVVNLFNVAFFSMGNAIAIIVGHLLGANENEKAVDNVRKLSFTAVSATFVVAGILAIVAPFIPLLYNTEDEVKTLATQFLWVCALHMPLNAYLNSCYFTLRAGGRTVLTILFDSVSLWAISIPVALILITFTNISIVYAYLIVQYCDIIKCILGFILIKKGVWIRNIVSDTENANTN